VTRIGVDGHKYKGVTNIGFRPTVDREAGASLSIENALSRLQQGYLRQAGFAGVSRSPARRAALCRVGGSGQSIKKDIVNARRYFHWLKKKNLIA
jgi:hypothetical protein